MSGYPFFPITIAGFPLDWRAPVEHATVEAAYIQFTEREFTWRMIGSNWVRLILLRDVSAAFVPGAIAAVGRRPRVAFETARKPGRRDRQDVVAGGADRCRNPRVAGHSTVSSLQPAAILVVGGLVPHRMLARHLAGLRRSPPTDSVTRLWPLSRCRRFTSIRSCSRYGKVAIRCRCSRGTISLGQA